MAAFCRRSEPETIFYPELEGCGHAVRSKERGRVLCKTLQAKGHEDRVGPEPEDLNQLLATAVSKP